MTPLILDQGRFDLRLPTLRADRASGQAILVGVLAVAFGAIILARPTGDAGAASGGSPSAIPSSIPSDGAASTTTPGGASAGAATSNPASETAAPTPDPVASTTTAPATTEPTSAPSTSGATYRVKSGDTLSAIAARFGTTTRVLIQLNGIEDPSKLRIGQILKLP